MILATKIAGSGIDWIRGGRPITGVAIKDAIDGSLRRLQTDYIDLYQIHWPNRPSSAFGGHWTLAPKFSDATEHRDDIHETLRALDNAVKAGKIRHVGLSNETAWGTMQYLQLAAQHNLPRVVSIQNEYSLLDRIFEPELTEVAAFEQVGLLAWSPLAGGMISGKYLNGARPPKARWTVMGSRYIHRDTPAANAAVQAYMQLAAQHGLDVCQVALAFVTSRPFTTATIIGATTMEQLKTDIAAEKLTLHDDVIAGIEKIRREYPIVY